MKEQDAAHSFTELIELKEELERTRLLLQNCNGDIIRADRELTHLRSELQQKDEWISFDEQLPKDYQRVIWFDKRGGDIEIGYFVPSQSKIQPYASHWKSLPEPPKKAKLNN